MRGGLEVLAALAVPHVEVVPDHGEQHGMRAIEQEAVLNRVDTEDGWKVRGAASVPAGTMPDFWFDVIADAHASMLPARMRWRPGYDTMTVLGSQGVTRVIPHRDSVIS